ncbi:MAG: endonuclease MutS2 [Epsilonproteobacteria bacterium]|nr:endonuclease MutS2 [Campylobacterota bacterium]
MQDIVKKLDLFEYIEKFYTFFSRKKPLYIEGDTARHLKYINELSKIDFKAPKGVCDLDENLIHLKKMGTLKLYEIYEFIKIVNYFAYLKKLNLEGLLQEWLGGIDIPREIDEIRGFFDEKGELRSDIDEEFLSVENQLAKNRENLKLSLRRIMDSSKISPYLVDRQIHYINDEESILVRGGFNHVLKGSVIARSSSGFFYVLPESVKKLKDKEAEFLSKKEEIKHRYEKLISKIFFKYLKFLRYINREFDRFDHYQARVFFSKTFDYQFLLPSKNKDIIIKDFKHPAINDPKPITVEFKKKILFITGVNAGGKTMLLKSILSSVFLSKYLIPMSIDAANSKVGSFKKIVAILDDPQNVKNDISTFAGRVGEFGKLFGINDAIVGVDEIELGTDSDEAAALFKVVLEELIKKDIKIIVTTHHKRLSSMMASLDEVELYAALYDEKNRVPTYEFLKGTIGKSYAFETAFRYGIPVGIVQKAKELYGKEEKNLNDLIQKNIELELELKEKNKRLSVELDRVEKEKDALKELKHKSQEEIDRVVNSYEMKYKELIGEVKKIAKQKDTKDIHRSLNKIDKIKKDIKIKKVSPKEDIKAGDSVKYGNIKGVVLSVKKDEALVDCDGVKMRVPLGKLKKSTVLKKKKKLNTNIKVQKPQSSSIKIDLHGLRAEEAIEKLDKFLSDALITGYDEVLISHGIGTGKLAYAVKEFLKRHPKIKSFEDAPIGLGGYGATLVKL